MLLGYDSNINVSPTEYNEFFSDNDTSDEYWPDLAINICYAEKVTTNNITTEEDRWYGCFTDKCIKDSFSLSKACLTANNFETGGCEASSFGITIHDPDFIKVALGLNNVFKNRPIIVTLLTRYRLAPSTYAVEYSRRSGDYQNGIRLFTGFIDDLVINVDNMEAQITAYDIFNLFDKTDGSRRYNLTFPANWPVATAIQFSIDNIADEYRIPISQPDIIKPDEMNNNNWWQLFKGNSTSWQNYISIRRDSDNIIENPSVSRNMIVSKEVVKFTEDLANHTETTVTRKININKKNLDIEMITQTVVKNTQTQDETTTSQTILAQLKEDLPIPDDPEVAQANTVTITNVNAEGEESSETFEGVRTYVVNIPATFEDIEGTTHFTSNEDWEVFVYKEPEKTNLVLQTKMSAEEFQGEKETLSFSGNYISDKTSVRDMIRAWCQLNGLFAYADSYGRIVYKELAQNGYNYNSPNLVIDDSDTTPSGALRVNYAQLGIGSNEAFTPIKQVVIRNSEQDTGYGRYPDRDWDEDEFGDYKGKENIILIESSVYIADYKKEAKMNFARSLWQRVVKITAGLSVKPYPYNRQFNYGNNVMPKYEITGVTFNPYLEPTDQMYVNYKFAYSDDIPVDYWAASTLFYTYIFNMDISMNNGFKFDTNNQLDYDTHWLKYTGSGFNIDDPESSGISDGGGSGGSGLAAFAVTAPPEHPRANTIYFIVEDE